MVRPGEGVQRACHALGREKSGIYRGALTLWRDRTARLSLLIFVRFDGERQQQGDGDGHDHEAADLE
jgi:hypothetical protein